MPEQDLAAPDRPEHQGRLHEGLRHQGLQDLHKGWRKSRASAVGNCVEVRQVATTIQVRDSKDPDGAHLTFTLPEWEAFLVGVRHGEFDPHDQAVLNA